MAGPEYANCTGVCVHGPTVTVVQQRTRSVGIKADPASRVPEATPVRASVSSDLCA
jgi:hypothetical protein